MPVKINSYGGYGIWFFRRYYSQYTSKFILTSVEKNTEKKDKQLYHPILPIRKNSRF